MKCCIGKHIESLGYFSTSTEKDVAGGFMGNVLFVIHVKDNQR